MSFDQGVPEGLQFCYAMHVVYPVGVHKLPLWK
jgi:hypothetical protein